MRGVWECENNNQHAAGRRVIDGAYCRNRLRQKTILRGQAASIAQAARISEMKLPISEFSSSAWEDSTVAALNTCSAAAPVSIAA